MRTHYFRIKINAQFWDQEYEQRTCAYSSEIMKRKLGMIIDATAHSDEDIFKAGYVFRQTLEYHAGFV
jgi:hypothetical protein